MSCTFIAGELPSHRVSGYIAFIVERYTVAIDSGTKSDSGVEDYASSRTVRTVRKGRGFENDQLGRITHLSYPLWISRTSCADQDAR